MNAGTQTRRPSRCRRIAGGAVVVAVLAGLSPAAAAPAAPAAGVVDLPEGGFLPGRLVPLPADAERPRTTLRWQSPLFAEPVEFAIDGIERVRFPKGAAAAAPADCWRVELAGDDALVGRLDSIDADHVVVKVPDIGPDPLRLRRGLVERLTRLGGGKADTQVFVPGSLADWDAERTAWRELAGRLACRTPGRAAVRDTGSPSRACFEIMLSWDDRPDFEILLAARPVDTARLAREGQGPEGDAEDYRLEVVSGELVAIREGRAAALDRVASLPAGPGAVRVAVFVDQERGRMAVVIPDAAGRPTVAFDEAIPPRQPSVQGGFGIRLRSGDVRLDGLRVSPWSDPAPQLPAAPDLGGPGTAIEAFDGATARFTVRDAAGPRQVPAADVAAIVLASSAVDRPPAAPGTVAVAFHDGCWLTGRIVDETSESIRLECPAVADPVTCEFRRLAVIEPVAERRGADLPGRAGILEADEGRLAGCLANAVAPGTGIAWLPRGGARPVGFAATARGMRIVYPAAPAAPPAAGQAGALPATVYLKTGDSLTCEVLAAGPEGLRIRMPGAPDLLVPPLVLRAVELVPTAAAVLAKSRFERLLTLARSQQADPPTHLLRLTNGDYLRGKLVALDDGAVVMEVAGVRKELPRSDVARLIWLSIEGDGADAAAAAAMAAAAAGDGMPLRAALHDGRWLTMRATGLEGTYLVGTSGVLDRVGLGLDRCVRIDLRPAADAAPARNLPYAQWKLQPAALPRALRAEPARDAHQGPAAAPVQPAHPLAGKPAVVPVLALLEPVAGWETLTPERLVGSVTVLPVFGPDDAASIAALRQLQAAIGPLAADGVEVVAVAERADRRAVARAVEGLDPRPPIALDEAGIMESRLGKASLPACVVFDREGRVADVVAFAPEAVAGIRTRAADLAERTRRSAAEFRELAAAREAALTGDRDCLQPLGALLDAESELVRRRSIALLRQLTGVSSSTLPYAPDAVGADREDQVRRWRQWLAANGVSADLSFPRRAVAQWADAPVILGRTLVCCGERVLELDEQGAVAFEIAAHGPWACDVTPDGHRLIGEHGGRAVVEYDRQGKEVWAVRGLPGGPMSVRRLAGGNTLMALSDGGLVAEYDAQGKLAWSVPVAGRPCDARRLPDGNTLVAAHRANRIVELDPRGKEVWAVEGIEDPQTAQRLPDGNTLVAMSVPGIVREIDRDGRTVWERWGFKVPVDVQRLPDGTTLVQEQGGDLVELDPGGTEVGRRPTAGNRFLRW